EQTRRDFSHGAESGDDLGLHLGRESLEDAGAATGVHLGENGCDELRVLVLEDRRYRRRGSVRQAVEARGRGVDYDLRRAPLAKGTRAEAAEVAHAAPRYGDGFAAPIDELAVHFVEGARRHRAHHGGDLTELA